MPLSRITLPNDFYDIVSSQMLVQPLPQFLFAKLAIAAQAAASFDISAATSALTASDRGPVPSPGAAPMDLEQMQLALVQAPLASAIRAVAEVAQTAIGHTIRIVRPVWLGGGFTELARTIGSNTPISLQPMEVSLEQVSVTVKRVVGPYAAGGTQPQPLAVDRLDAMRSTHSLVGLFGLQLKQDRLRYLDGVFASLFDAGANVARPAGLTADNQFPASGEVPMDLDTLYRAEELLVQNNIPRFADGTYCVILSQRQMRQLKLDPDFSKLAVFEREQNPLNIPMITRIGQLVVLESSTVPTDTTTVAGQTISRGMMFGPGAVGYGVADPCRVVPANEDNYGETVKVVWMAYEASAVLDNRFICSIRSC